MGQALEVESARNPSSWSTGFRRDSPETRPLARSVTQIGYETERLSACKTTSASGVRPRSISPVPAAVAGTAMHAVEWPHGAIGKSRTSTPSPGSAGHSPRAGGPPSEIRPRRSDPPFGLPNRISCCRFDGPDLRPVAALARPVDRIGSAPKSNRISTPMALPGQ